MLEAFAIQHTPRPRWPGGSDWLRTVLPSADAQPAPADTASVKNRHDLGAAVMQHAMSPQGDLAALDEKVTSPDGSISNPESAPPDEPRDAR